MLRIEIIGNGRLGVSSLEGARKGIPFPGRDQQAGGRVGLLLLVKPSRYRRGPALGQPGGCRYRRFLIQVSEYLVNHRRVFNAGDQLDETGAFATNISLREGLLLAVCCY